MASDNKRSPGFHHVALRAFDFERTVAFYEQGFGMKRRYGWGAAPKRAVMMDSGDGNYIEIFEGREAGETVAEGGILHFALRTPDCRTSHARGMAAGASLVAEPKVVHIQGGALPLL